MLDLVTGRSSDCTGISRRTFLRVGGLSAFGLSLPRFLRPQAKAGEDRRRRSRVASCCGCRAGRATSTRFDPKPDAPAEIRGEFGTIPTTLPGVRFAEHLPMLAKQTDKLSRHPRPRPEERQSHGTADHLMMSGHKFNAVAAVPLLRLGRRQGARLPATACCRSCSSAGTSTAASTAASPASSATSSTRSRCPTTRAPPAFKVRDLSVAGDAERPRLDRRYAMLADLENYQKAVERRPAW